MRTTFRWLVALACATATPLAAQDLADYDYENLSFRGIGVDAGYMWADRVENTETYGVRFDLGYLGPGIRLAPSVTYWSSSLADSELRDLEVRLDRIGPVTVPPGSLGSVEWSDIAVNLDAHFVWNTPLDVLAYLGLGAGLHVLNGRSDAFADTFVDDLLDSVTAGTNAVGGLELEPLGPLRIYGEARYTVLSDIRYASVRGGIAVMFGGGGAVVGLAAPDTGRRARP